MANCSGQKTAHNRVYHCTLEAGHHGLHKCYSAEGKMRWQWSQWEDDNTNHALYIIDDKQDGDQ